MSKFFLSRRRLVAAGAALAMVLGITLVSAVAGNTLATATPSGNNGNNGQGGTAVQLSCTAASVDLTGYTTKPGTPAVTHTEWHWTWSWYTVSGELPWWFSTDGFPAGGWTPHDELIGVTWTWTTTATSVNAPPDLKGLHGGWTGSGWQKGAAVQVEDTPAVDPDPTPNTVTITVDGTQVVSTTFGTSYTWSKQFAPADSHSLQVSAVAWNGTPAAVNFNQTKPDCTTTIPVPAAPVPGAATCSAAGTLTIPTNADHVSWARDGNSNNVKATADDGYVFANGKKTINFHEDVPPQLTGDDCASNVSASIGASAEDATCVAPVPTVNFTAVDGVTYSTTETAPFKPGTQVHVLATADATHKFVSGALPAGWTFQDAHHATYVVTLNPLGECKTAFLGDPTVTPMTACNTYGSITHPWNNGIDYTISGNPTYDNKAGAWVGLSGTYTITATLNSADYYQFGNTNGWTVNGNTATTTRDVGTYTGCGYVGALQFTPIAACNTYGSITHPWNDHVSYTISGDDWTVKQGSYTVTATAAAGYTLALPASDAGWSLNADRTVATHTADLGAYTKCAYVGAPQVNDIASCASYGSIVHPWNDGVSYAISGNPTYDNKAGAWVDLSGTYTITATQVAGWSFALPLPAGWTLQQDGTATYDANVGTYTGCGYVGPLQFTPIAACNTYGSITHPWNDHVSYTISGDDWTVKQGSYTVTATAAAGYTLALPASDAGWSLNADRTVATHTADIGDYTLCDATPVAPTVSQAVCTGPGTSSPATVVDPNGNGVTYTIAQDLSSVTATLDNGYQWQKGLPNGWTAGAGNTLVYDVTLIPAGACLVGVAPLTPTAQAGTCDETTGFDSPAAITSPADKQDTDGITYFVSGLTVTAAADPGYQIAGTDGWVNGDGVWTYTASVTQPFCPAVVALPASVPGNPDGTLTGVPGTTNPGQQLDVTGTGFAPGATVNFGIYSTPLLLATVSADASGTAKATVVIPADFIGNHTVVAAGSTTGGTPQFLAAKTTVVKKVSPAGNGGGLGVGGVSTSRGPGVAPNGGSSSGLANTGTRENPIALTQIALLALLAGAGLLVATRRRARKH